GARGGERLAVRERPGQLLLEPARRALDRDAAGRGVGQRGEARPGGVILGILRALAEQQLPERRLAALERAGPPHDRLVLRAGERDVGEPEVLAAALSRGLAAVRVERRAGAADVDRAAVAGVGIVVGDR